VKLSLTRVPASITPSLTRVCRTISADGDLRFVTVDAAADATPNKCIFNAQAYVAAHGGEVVLGWQISVWEGVLAEFIGHAVVRIEDNYRCVTPCKYGDQRLLFLSDSSLTFDFTDATARLPSRRVALAERTEIRRMVEIENAINALKTLYPVTSGNVVLAYPDAVKLDALNREKSGLVVKILLATTHHNAPCVCGSGRKFRKCCKAELDYAARQSL